MKELDQYMVVQGLPHNKLRLQKNTETQCSVRILLAMADMTDGAAGTHPTKDNDLTDGYNYRTPEETSQACEVF